MSPLTTLQGRKAFLFFFGNTSRQRGLRGDLNSLGLFIYFTFLSDEGPTLKTLDVTIGMPISIFSTEEFPIRVSKCYVATAEKVDVML